ncbi:MAG: LysE family transporter, partial [Hydrogenophaga sp.]
MDLNVWLAFFAACWVIAISPGSGAVLSMTHGLAYGVRGASATIIGLQLGVAVTLLVAGAGVGALLLASATAFTVVKIAGAGYLIWLGWRQWVAPVGSDAAGPAPGASGSPATPVALPSWREQLNLARRKVHSLKTAPALVASVISRSENSVRLWLRSEISRPY